MNRKNSTRRPGTAVPGRDTSGSRIKSGFSYVFACVEAGFARIVLAERGSQTLGRSGASAVSILRRRTKLDGKTTQQVQDRRTHGRQSWHAEEGGGQVRYPEHRARREGASQGAYWPQPPDGRSDQDQGENRCASARRKGAQGRRTRLIQVSRVRIFELACEL